MAGKQYEVARQFRRVDPESGDVAWHEPGESYSGPIEEYHLSNEGPDGKGALLKDKSGSAPKPEGAAIFSTTSDSDKGK